MKTYKVVYIYNDEDTREYETIREAEYPEQAFHIVAHYLEGENITIIDVKEIK